MLSSNMICFGGQLFIISRGLIARERGSSVCVHREVQDRTGCSSSMTIMTRPW